MHTLKSLVSCHVMEIMLFAGACFSLFSVCDEDKHKLGDLEDMFNPDWNIYKFVCVCVCVLMLLVLEVRLFLSAPKHFIST